MSEEKKKGHVRVTVDVEVNEALMDLCKEMASKMPEMVSQAMKKKE
ncbi:MAG: hypothetical protein ABSG92_07920 [Conexivisphaerales archaeon]